MHLCRFPKVPPTFPKHSPVCLAKAPWRRVIASCSVAPAFEFSVATHFQNEKRREVAHARHTEVIASRSELLSLHCPRHPLLLALLPACAGSQVIMRQDCSAYAAEPLRTAGLLEAAHQYSLQDMCRSACTPSPLHSLLRRDSLRTYITIYGDSPSGKTLR